MPPTLLNAREVARQLGASYDEVLGWTRRGLIPHIKVGREYYYNLSQVVKALRKLPRETEVPAACR